MERNTLFLDWKTGYCEEVIFQNQIGLYLVVISHLNPSSFFFPQAYPKFYMEMQRAKDSCGSLEKDLDHRHQDTYQVIVIKTCRLV